MAVNAYAKLLKELACFTQTKYSVLSRDIGYDTSYISKWITGERLPAAKNVDCINQKFSKIFSEIIVKNHREKEFFHKFMVPEVYSEEEMIFQVYQCLSNAYRESLNRPDNSNQVNFENESLVMGRMNCRTLLQKMLKYKLEDLSTPVSIVITGEFCSLANNHFWQLFEDVNINIFPCSIHVMLDLSNLGINGNENVGKLYHCLDKLLDYNIYIYEQSSIAYQNIIVVENKFAIIYLMNEDGYIDMCVPVVNPVQVQMIYNKCKSLIMTQPILLLPKETLGMDRFGYRDTFFTSNRFFFFLTNGFEFLLPDEVFKRLYANTEKGLYKPATKEWVQRIEVIWKNLMDKAELHFILPTNAIIRYLETGYIHITDISYQLSKDERLLHIKQILSVMNLNHNIILGVLLPSVKAYRNESVLNLSFYSNYSTAFLKKNLKYISEKTFPIYLIDNPIFLQYIQNYFESQKESLYYKEYSDTQLGELYKQYHFLLDFLDS